MIFLQNQKRKPQILKNLTFSSNANFVFYTKKKIFVAIAFFFVSTIAVSENFSFSITPIFGKTSGVLEEKIYNSSKNHEIISLLEWERDIFFAGLDQESSAGFQHKMPNSLEYLNETADFRLSPKENRITSSRFSSEGSLAIYRDWFSNKSKKIANRTFRIASKNPFKNSLGEIRDIDVNEFLKKTNGTKNEIMVEDSGEIKTENRKKIFLEEFSKARKDKSFLFEIFPTDSILYKRESDENRRREILQKIDEKAKDLEERIMRPFLKR